MSIRLSGVLSKLARAQMHAEEFERVCGRYAESRPYSVGEKQESYDNGILRTFFIDNVAPIPKELPVILGDCIQNLRSALDHLAWQLVLAAGNTPTDRTAFPIFESEFTKKGKVRTIRIDGGVDPRALALIEAAQPYVRKRRGQDPRDDPLAILHDLSNIDKHRTLLLVGVSYDKKAFWGEGVGLARAKPAVATRDEPIALEKNAVVEAVHYGVGHPHTDMDVDFEMSVRITFGDGERCGGQVVSDVLQQLLHAVGGVIVPALSRFL